MRMLVGLHRAGVRLATFLLRRISVSLCISNIAFIVLIDCLKMMIGSGNVMGCRKMVVLARRVGLGVRHDLSPSDG